MTRIAVGGFLHESNSFVPGRTDFAHFMAHRDQPPLVRGEEVLTWLTGSSYALSGFISEAGADAALVPLVWTSGGAGAVVTTNAFERIAGEMVDALSRAMPVDAVYLDLHGAMVSEAFEDVEGELLRRIRASVGTRTPIVASLDYHANVTPDMVSFTDAMVAYHTYPHVDRRETGMRAAKALRHVLARGRPTARVLRKIPFLLSLNAQCTLLEPSRSIVAQSVALHGTDVLTVAYAAGFPPSDLYWCGPAVAVHGYDERAVHAAADALERTIVAREADFAHKNYTADEAVRTAMDIARRARRPVILADTQDNPGCGGTGDTTGLLESLVRHDAQDAVLGILCDAPAAAAAHRAGEGATIALDLGGRSGPAGVRPFHGQFRVRRLGSGRFTTTGPSVGGRQVDLGPMALLAVGGVSVVVSSKRMQAHDQAPFHHVGIDPGAQKLLALKSSVHFRADFGPLAEDVLTVVAPGFHVVDTTQYRYRRLRSGVRLHPMGPAYEGARGA